jgi:hypothetical protein
VTVTGSGYLKPKQGFRAKQNDGPEKSAKIPWPTASGNAERPVRVHSTGGNRGHGIRAMPLLQ